MTSSIDLRGQVAVVTGGGRGLGRAFAEALAAAGCAVAVVARSAAELAETVRLVERTGAQARPFTADVTDAGAVDNAFAEIVTALNCRRGARRLVSLPARGRSCRPGDTPVSRIAKRANDPARFRLD
jgi:NAD(P)-dependent dehydrogenase (short-subunit alcohol dehydrogenase family)